ncbi:hypothetical protein MC885_002939 [Smutsia gigantea]|nr:hypothetical protein MC885_002939 [Smutsia gigantea]
MQAGAGWGPQPSGAVLPVLELEPLPVAETPSQALGDPEASLLSALCPEGPRIRDGSTAGRNWRRLEDVVDSGLGAPPGGGPETRGGAGKPEWLGVVTATGNPRPTPVSTTPGGAERK